MNYGVYLRFGIQTPVSSKVKLYVYNTTEVNHLK